MKTLINFRSSWSCALLLSIAIGCKHTDSTDIAPINVTCSVQTIDNVTVENGITSKRTNAFGYDTKGQLTSIASTSPGGTGDAKVMETYTYDDNGYVTSYKYTSASTLSNQSKSETYTYVNGRLNTTTLKYTDQSTALSTYQTNSTATYSYDAAGSLAQVVTSSTTTTTIIPIYSSTSSSSTSTRTYANGILTSIKELTDGKESTIYTIDTGRITLEVSSNGTKKRYTYNTDGYQTKREDLSATNALTSSEVTEYGSVPALKGMYPIRKGFPLIASPYGKEDRAVSHSVLTYSGIVFDYQFQYQLDGNGYPVKTVKTNTTTNGTVTTMYTYGSCQ